MTTVALDNCGILTKMGDSSTHTGALIPPVDGIDFPHSGLIKVFDAQRYGFPILKDNKTTGSDSSTAGAVVDKNFNIKMDDTTSSGKTTVAVMSGAVIRNGKLVSIATGTSTGVGAHLTEVATSATPAGNDTDGYTQFKEQGSSGENFYHVIVVNHANAIKIRNPSAKDKVAELGAGDIPIAILRVQNGETKTARHIQFLGTDRRDGSLSIYHNASNVPTEAMTIESSNTRTTFTNKIEDADIRFMLADNTASEKFEIYEDDGDTEVFSVNGLGTAEVKGTLIANSLNVGANAELQVTESSDNITFANTVNDKTLTFSVLDDGGNAKTASFTAVTHDNNIQLKGVEEVIIVALSDETTDLTTGTGKVVMHMPFAMTLTKVKASVNTAPQGADILIDINEATASGTIMNTHATQRKLTIVANEITSETATGTKVATLTDTALADNAAIFFDIDQVGSSTAGKGLKVTLYGYRT